MSLDRSRAWQVALVVVLAVLVAALAYQAGAFALPWAENRDHGVVAVTDVDSGETSCVVVEVADTQPERYRGLSEHDSLENGSGMWFVHDDEQDLTYVMRNMSFPIDVVFVGADGRVNEVTGMRAPEPGDDGEQIQASGRAKWVLELPRGYAAATGIDAGDRVDVNYGTTDRADCPN